MRWTPFYFEGNQAWGLCSTREDWKRIVRDTARGWGEDEGWVVARLLMARQNINGGDRFGLYPEYRGTKILLDFFVENYMAP